MTVTAKPFFSPKKKRFSFFKPYALIKRTNISDWLFYEYWWFRLNPPLALQTLVILFKRTHLRLSLLLRIGLCFVFQIYWFSCCIYISVALCVCTLSPATVLCSERELQGSGGTPLDAAALCGRLQSRGGGGVPAASRRRCPRQGQRVSVSCQDLFWQWDPFKSSAGTFHCLFVTPEKRNILLLHKHLTSWGGKIVTCVTQ